MILCVTLNAALDVTYLVDTVRWNSTNRVASVAERAGGKGVNVGRVLAMLGHEVVLTGLLAGDRGARISDELTAAGLVHDFLPVEGGESRRTLAIVDGATGETTGFWEGGPRIETQAWSQFRDRFSGLLTGARAVVLSGSMPVAVPDDAYAQLVAIAREAGVPVVLDADGVALVNGVAAAPDIVKPNTDELYAATGLDDPLVGAALLRERGAGAVVVSLGVGGIVASTAAGRWAARLPTALSGNPTGAGDAGVAALARGLVTGNSWPERLREMVALSASAVLRPLAGDVDLASYHRFVDSVELEEI
ncbi:1-phosphofructokinase family hexose kinase [Amycolatopsis acidiphila]|uniref:1-phosphofructokinase family hexose kinase n=1 Tax=Amycolatopsis acidiphila TaxID=715473 RepID=A0A558AIK2_9PSEU|nr:1-phosphofructokinase family hexose kinase [Amycolatopsis acidiphila]TVT24092.1 1-phosphofructokinase family hexose kinase [Amycolatopsis acidiphila]UIJ57753.1 1-phosphofructokinase family hexose kinase [Amycolatopsis acidiphila]GHG87486.1 sugar kinase [Amycolatopsis acidiphila]